MVIDQHKSTVTQGVSIIVPCGAVFWLFLGWHPVEHSVVVAIDTGATIIAVLVACGLCIGRPPWFWLSSRRQSKDVAPEWRAARWVPVCLGVGSLCFAVVTFLEAFFGSTAPGHPFSSWIDAGYLIVYPLLLSAILLLPRRPLSIAASVRTAFDSVIIIAALSTFSWYFVLGPTMLRGGETVFTKVVGTAFPIGDIALAFCLLGLWMQARVRELDGVIVLFFLGVSTTIIADSILDYQLLQGTYTVGAAIDSLWPLSYLLAGLGAQEIRRLLSADLLPTSSATSGPTSRISARKALIPYAFLPLVGALVWHAAGAPGDQHLKLGVYVCAAVMCAMVVARQVVALLENARLNEELSRHSAILEQRNLELQQMLVKNDKLASANAQLEVKANTDPVTGLANRTVLHDRVGQALRTHQRDGVAVALLLLDLHRFQDFNDSLGQVVGDRLLQQVSTRLRGAVRRVDTVARLAADEFAILLPGTEVAGAEQVARNVLVALQLPFAVDEYVLNVGAAIGIATAEATDLDAHTLVRHASAAMYLASRTLHGYMVYEAAQDLQSLEQLALISALRLALESEQLQVYYQPKVSLSTGRVCGFEALARWPHPEHGFIPPDRFIPVAELGGLIGPLTIWVLESAVRQRQQWSMLGFDVPIAVNLSASSLEDQQLCSTLSALLRDGGVPPGKLILEITESTLMSGPASAMEFFSELKELGVRLSIDDFGTGYSSLSYLKHLPVDEIKIDRSFVTGLGAERTKTDQAIVRAIIAVGQALQRSVVAEGVEDEMTWKVLQELGCDAAQGYYIGRPMTAPATIEWLRASPWASRVGTIHLSETVA